MTHNRPSIPDGSWRVDPLRSEVGFSAKDLWGLRTVRGIFTALSGALTLRAGRAEGKLTIAAASLDTANARRDRHLRSSAFFDVERHPQIVFTPTAVIAQEGGVAVAGELTVAATCVRLEIPLTVEQLGDDAIRCEGTTRVSRQEVGLIWNMLGMIRGDAIVHTRLTLENAGH